MTVALQGLEDAKLLLKPLLYKVYCSELFMKKNIFKRGAITTKGFTLVELMIAMSIGLVLFAGVISIFIGMRTTTAETSSYGELQENGRFAIAVLTDDLLRQNFWGEYSGILSSNELLSIPEDPPGNDCAGVAGGLNNATFPNGIGPFRTLWGQTIVAGALDPLGCFAMPVGTETAVGSDVIQLKRVRANPVPQANLIPGNFYLTSNTIEAGIFLQGQQIPIISGSQLWQYQHHVYYVRNVTFGASTVPVLMQGQLINGNMVFAPVIDGIERISFMYGIDTDIDTESIGYGVVDAYVSAGVMNDNLWNNSNSRILAIKIFVLSRAAVEDRDYFNTNTYLLGNVPFVVNDRFRRLLFSTTVTLYNNGVESWQ